MADLLAEHDGGTVRDLPFLKVTEYYISYYAAGEGHTARAKRLDLEHFVRFLTRHRAYSRPDKLRVSDWDTSSVQEFVETRLAEGEAPATVARRLATLKHMGRTLAERTAGFVNPAREVKPPRFRVTRPKALSDTELHSVRANAAMRKERKASFNRFRNEILFELLLDTGLRAEEVRLLRRGQLDDSLNWIKNVRTKGRRYRNVYITSPMQPRLHEYLEARHKKLQKLFTRLSKADDRALPLFISLYRANPEQPESFLMGAKSIWRAINELSADTRLHPHLLRHSYALDLLDSSNDVRLVAQALGHSDVRVTMRYTERKEEEVAAALEKSRRESE